MRSPAAPPGKQLARDGPKANVKRANCPKPKARQDTSKRHQLHDLKQAANSLPDSFGRRVRQVSP